MPSFKINASFGYAFPPFSTSIHGTYHYTGQTTACRWELEETTHTLVATFPVSNAFEIDPDAINMIILL
jgi:hypothetical protein